MVNRSHCSVFHENGKCLRAWRAGTCHSWGLRFTKSLSFKEATETDLCVGDVVGVSAFGQDEAGADGELIGG